MESENVEISRKELETLLARAYMLDELESAGVDNWPYYDDALADYWNWLGSGGPKKDANNYRPA